MLQTRMLSAAAQVVRKHIPMIKFRKGTPSSAQSTSAAATSSSSSSSTTQVNLAPTAKKHGVISFQLSDLSQLPSSFRRTAITQEEIEAINSGGASLLSKQ